MSSSSSFSSSSDSDVDSGSRLPHTALLYSDPAPPTVVQSINIQSRVPIVLDLNEDNYTAWARAFSVVFGQYGLGDHIDGSAPKGDSDWVQNDCAIVSWLYNRVAADLLTVVSTDEDSASSMWRGIRDLFRDNRSTRAVYLNAEFRRFFQGDLSVLAYCTRMKSMADRLANLGAPVTEPDLVLNIIRGLSPSLHQAVPHITLRKRLPSFLKTRSMLQLEEHRIGESAKLQAAAALLAQARSVHPPSQLLPGPTGSSFSSNNHRPNTPSSPASSSNKKKKKKPSNIASSSSFAPPAVPPGFQPSVHQA